MRGIALVACLAVVAGCSTVVRPFTSLRPDYTTLPADDMRAVAHDIEAAVQSGNREPQVANRNGIVVDTDIVKQAIRTRAARLELLNEFRAGGFGIEQRNGLVEIRNNGDYRKAFSRRQRDRNALLVMRENEDRWALYENIIKASKLPPKSLGAIQQIFYEERVKVLPEGQKYESESGADAVKGAS